MNELSGEFTYAFYFQPTGDLQRTGAYYAMDPLGKELKVAYDESKKAEPDRELIRQQLLKARAIIDDPKYEYVFDRLKSEIDQTLVGL